MNNILPPQGSKISDQTCGRHVEWTAMLAGSHRKFSSGGLYEYVWVNMHTLITSECIFHETSLLSCLTDINK